MISSGSFSGLWRARRLLRPLTDLPTGCRNCKEWFSGRSPAYSQTGCSGLAPAPELWGSGCRNLALRAFVNKPPPSSKIDLQGAEKRGAQLRRNSPRACGPDSDIGQFSRGRDRKARLVRHFEGRLKRQLDSPRRFLARIAMRGDRRPLDDTGDIALVSRNGRILNADFVVSRIMLRRC
jgi:hypothetical protein